MQDTTILDPETNRIRPIATPDDQSDLPRGVGIKLVTSPGLIDGSTEEYSEPVVVGVGDDNRAYFWNAQFAVWKLIIRPDSISLVQPENVRAMSEHVVVA